jgi:hypothetical protein
MNAVELKYANGEGTGIWYCGQCLDLKYGCTSGEPRSRLKTSGMRVTYGNGRPDSQHHREEAEVCCTGRMHCYAIQCTGCHRVIKKCICGRAQKNTCVACGGKLFFKEGKKIRWGTGIAEICYACQGNKHLAAMLVDAPK